MFISDVACRCFLFSIIFVLLSPLAFAESGPSLGEPVTPEEIAKWDISIAPDGLNLPPGEGNARLGKEVYRQHCVRCHGDGAEGSNKRELRDQFSNGARIIDKRCMTESWAPAYQPTQTRVNTRNPVRNQSIAFGNWANFPCSVSITTSTNNEAATITMPTFWSNHTETQNGGTCCWRLSAIATR